VFPCGFPILFSILLYYNTTVRYYRIILIIILLFIPSFQASSAPLVSTITYFPGPVPLTEEVLQENRMRRIVRFDIIGAEEKNNYVIRSVVDVKAGDYLASLDLRRMLGQLGETGLFAQTDFFFRPHHQGYVITLRIREQKEVITLPVGTVSLDDVRAGGSFFADSPLDFGTQVRGSRVWQAGGLNGVIRYLNPHFRDLNQRMEMVFTGRDLNQTHADTDAQVIRQYRGYSAELDMNWSFRTDAKIKPLFGLQYNLFEVDEQWKETLNPPSSSEIAGTNMEVVYNDFYFLHFFDQGFQSAFRVSHNYTFGDRENLFAYHLLLDFNYNPLLQHRLHLGLRSGYNPVPEVLLGFLKGSGHLLLPANRSIDRLYFSGTAAYELPVHRNPRSIVTAYGFAELGLYSPSVKDYQFYYGPGVGIHLYAPRLSAPIVGASLGMNLDSGYIASSFFAGISL